MAFPEMAVVTGSAEVTIVTCCLVQGVHAPLCGQAHIICAGVVIIALEVSARDALTRGACVPQGAGIVVITGFALNVLVGAPLSRLTIVQGARIAVSTVRAAHGGTFPFLALVADSTRVTVIAEQIVIHMHAAKGRGAGILRAVVVIVTIEVLGKGALTRHTNVALGALIAVVARCPVKGLVQAPLRRVAGFRCAPVAVVTFQDRPSDTVTHNALVARGAGITVSAGLLVVQVDTTARPGATVRGAGVDIVAVEIGGKNAGPPSANVPFGASVSIIARCPVEGLMHAAHQSITGVARALIPIIAVQGLRTGQTLATAAAISHSTNVAIRTGSINRRELAPLQRVAGVYGARVAVVAKGCDASFT